MPFIAIRATDESGVVERRARWVELRDEDISKAYVVKGRVEGARSRRKVSRRSQTSYESAAGDVHVNVTSEVMAIAAEESGVDECRAGRVELRHESIGPHERNKGPVVRGVESAGSSREVGAESSAYYISTAGGVHGDMGFR